MIVGIDASNIRGGGGLTHLTELLRNVDPGKHGITRITLWSGTNTLRACEDQVWLRKKHHPLLDRSLFHRVYWQHHELPKAIVAERCDVLFVPGGTYLGDFHPFVSMSQNLLPFEWKEARRYGFSLVTLKFMLLRQTQAKTFRKSDGIIFLTQYAAHTVQKVLGDTTNSEAIIPHGIDNRFRHSPRDQKSIGFYSKENPLKLLYVSPVAPYKHHREVIEAVQLLREYGFPVILELVGGIRNGKKTFPNLLHKFDPNNEWIYFQGLVPFEQLHKTYHHADLFIFASSCENMPIILLEAMAGGLPIASSNKGPMPEILGKCGVYFNPESPNDIFSKIKLFIENPDLRWQKAYCAYQQSLEYTWERCANETFDFIVRVGSDTSNRLGN